MPSVKPEEEPRTPENTDADQLITGHLHVIQVSSFRFGFTIWKTGYATIQSDVRIGEKEAVKLPVHPPGILRGSYRWHPALSVTCIVIPL